MFAAKFSSLALSASAFSALQIFKTTKAHAQFSCSDVQELHLRGADEFHAPFNTEVKPFNPVWDNSQPKCSTKWYIFVTPCEKEEGGKCYEQEQLSARGNEQLEMMTCRLRKFVRCFSKMQGNVTMLASGDDDFTLKMTNKLHAELFRDNPNVRVVKDSKLNDFVPCPPNPGDINLCASREDLETALEAFDEHIHRNVEDPVKGVKEFKVGDEVQQLKWEYSISVIVLDTFLHRFFFTKLLQIPNGCWNRLRSPKPGSFSLIEVSGSGLVWAHTYADNFYLGGTQLERDDLQLF